MDQGYLLGGELPLNEPKYNSYLLQSGRSAIRLFLGQYKDLKFLLPEYLCKSIVDEFESANVKYSFYKINSDLSVDFNQLKSFDYDVFYNINYFGHQTDLPEFLKSKLIIDDCVFNIELPVHRLEGFKYFSFNSFRKVTPLPDGSLVKTNLTFTNCTIEKDKSDFVKTMIEGKLIKAEFIDSDDRSLEQKYLDLFSSANKMIDSSTGVFLMSDYSKEKLLTQYIDFEDRIYLQKDRYNFLKAKFKSLKIISHVKEASFFPIKVESRAAVLSQLRNKGIYLPFHWPSSYGLKHELYEELISIPLFVEYSDDIFQKVIQIIESVVHEN